MIFHVYAVWDSKSGAYRDYFKTNNPADALRSFELSSNNPDHHHCLFAEDFTLMELGTWDDEKGAHHDNHPPTAIARAISLKKENK